MPPARAAPASRSSRTAVAAAAVDAAPCVLVRTPKNVGGRCSPWPITAKMIVSFRPMTLNATAPTSTSWASSGTARMPARSRALRSRQNDPAGFAGRRLRYPDADQGRDRRPERRGVEHRHPGAADGGEDARADERRQDAHALAHAGQRGVGGREVAAAEHVLAQPGPGRAENARGRPVAEGDQVDDPQLLARSHREQGRRRSPR